ncbi:MAG: urease accessory protein UreD [Acetobacteraceae bacterium]
MFDAVRIDHERLARSTGRLGIVFRRRGPATALVRREESGCLRVRLPRPGAGAPPLAVTLNNAGGLAGGDELAIKAAWEEGTCAAISSAAAERVYRARGVDGPARIRTRIDVARDAEAEWLPQETILFDGARLDRVTRIVLADRSARFLGVESVVYGRLSRGEAIRSGAFSDRIVVERAGRAVLVDPTRLVGDIAALLDRPAVAGGGRAVASLIAADPDPERLLEPVRAAFERSGDDVEAGASAWDGILFARIVARDGLALRRALVAALSTLRGGRALPRVWHC